MATVPAWFNYETYMTNKLAQVGSSYTMTTLVEAFSAAGFVGVEGAYQHFLQYGANEDVSPAADFSPSQYYYFKAAQYYGKEISAVTELDAASMQVAIKNAGMNAWSHYTQYGTSEGINASNSFDTMNYLTAKAAAMGGAWTAAEVGKAISDAGMNAYEHFMLYGGKDASEVPAGSTFVVPEDQQTTDGNPGKTYVLTTAPDNIMGTAGDDTVNGYVNTTAGSTDSTFTAADVIDGAGGINTLNMTVAGGVAGAMPAAQVSNIQHFNIRDVATAASTYDFASIAGETQVWSDLSTNAVTFSSLGTGTTVGIRGNNVLTTLGNVTFDMATVTDAVSIAVDGGVKNLGAPTITASAGTATAATLSSTGAANTLGAVTLSGGSSTVKTLTVNAATDLTAALVAADFATDATLTVKGAGKVNFGSVPTGFDGAVIDASANTGGLTIGTSVNLKNFTGSSAADTVHLDTGLNATAKINLGDGNDKLLATAAGSTIAGTNVIDGGAGIDAISAALVNTGNAAAIKNFEVLDLSAFAAFNLDAAVMTNSTITGLTLGTSAAVAGVVTNIAAGVGLTVEGNSTAGSNTTIGVKDAATGTADSFTTTFAAVNTAAPVAANTNAGSIITAGIENYTIVSGGTNAWNAINLGTNANAQTVAINGASNLDLTFTGFGAVTPSVTTGVTLIDGSAATGKLAINAVGVTAATAGLTIKGGTGDDTITVSTLGGTLIGGAGNDKFVATAAVATGTDNVLVTIMDFAAGDSVTTGSTSWGTKIDVSTAANLQDALNLAATGATTLNWMQFGGDTYLVDGTLSAFAAGDLAVKLTGTIDLSGATFAAGTVTV